MPLESLAEWGPLDSDFDELSPPAIMDEEALTRVRVFDWSNSDT